MNDETNFCVICGKECKKQFCSKSCEKLADEDLEIPYNWED